MKNMTTFRTNTAKSDPGSGKKTWSSIRSGKQQTMLRPEAPKFVSKATESKWQSMDIPKSKPSEPSEQEPKQNPVVCKNEMHLNPNGRPVYHYNKTFKKAAEEHEMSMEDLGTHLAIFAMQAVQGLRSKAFRNEVIFEAMSLNEGGSNARMGTALNTARNGTGTEDSTNRALDGRLVGAGTVVAAISEVNLPQNPVGDRGVKSGSSVIQQKPATATIASGSHNKRYNESRRQEGQSAQKAA